MTSAQMSYTVQQLATLTGVSVRTLHHYDAIGLLCPARTANGHRVYGNAEVLRLQQILLYREVDVPLSEIAHILGDPSFDIAAGLREHRRRIEQKHTHLLQLLATIDATLARLDGQDGVSDNALFAAFRRHEREHAVETEKRWGNTDAYRQSRERTARMTKADIANIMREGDDLLRKIVTCIDEDAGSDAVQVLIAQHYENLRAFYDPTPALYRGLADLYVQDPRFRAHYEQFDIRLPDFMREAMLAFCDAYEQR